MEDLEFSKIVSVPKPLAWSKVYNAGKLFAVLSLEKELIDPENPDSLHVLGKDLLAKLEEEFFTLDFKDLKSIKQAIVNTFKDIDSNIKYSFAATFLSNKTLYVFTINNASVLVVRDGRMAKFSPTIDENPKSIVAFSGVVRDNDFIILITNEASDIINQENISDLSKMSLNEIADSLSSKILEKDDGKTSVIVAKYQDPQLTMSQIPKPFPEENRINEAKTKESKNYFMFFEKIKNIKFLQNKNLPHSKKVILTILILVLAIFVFGIFFGIKTQQNAKIKALFQKSYPTAEKKYNEGNSLFSLNKNKARENFLEAQKILEEVKPKLPQNSKEAKQILDLLAKVNNGLDETSPERIAKNQDKTKISITIQNGSGEGGVAGKAADFLKSKGYNVLSTANADNYKYVGATIKTKSSTSAYLDILKKDLSEKYSITATSSDLSADSTADALVIIGK